jgi:hypothetical protein
MSPSEFKYATKLSGISATYMQPTKETCASDKFNCLPKFTRARLSA